jgi:AraC-like DNA-binding protein
MNKAIVPPVCVYIVVGDMISLGCTARIICLKRQCLYSLHRHPHNWLHSVTHLAHSIEDLSSDHAEFAVVQLAEIYAEIASGVCRVRDFESAYAGFVESARESGAESPAAVADCFRGEIEGMLSGPHDDAREEASTAMLARRIAQVIEQRYGEHLTVETIARAAGDSSQRVRSAFRRETGVPLWQYLTAVRIRRAEELLLAGEKVEAVALMVGYTSKRQFLRQFKKHTGMSPTLFRTRSEAATAVS